jgi:hypothetical protein
MSRYNMDPSKGGVKQDRAKTRWHLLPDQLLEGTIAVLEIGAEKYSEWNWANGMPYSRVYNSLRRHLNAFWQGEDLDPETKLPHLDHLICNAIFLKYFFDRYPDLDDRPIHLKAPGSKAQPAAPPGDSSTTPQEATLSDLAQKLSLSEEELHALRSEPELIQVAAQALKARPVWNPPPPGSVLFETLTREECEAPVSSGVPLEAYAEDTDEPPARLFQEEGSPSIPILRRKRKNPGLGLPPID